MNPRINIFGRIAILAFSGFMLALPIYAVLSGKGFVGKGGVPLPAVAGIFIGAVCVIVGCLGIWFSLFAKASTLDELDEEAAFAPGDRPKIPRHALVCRYSLGSKAGGIFVDIKAGLIHFQNCHTRRGFLTSTEEWFSCSISDVMRVHNTRVYKVGPCLTIVTNVGGVRTPQSLVDYTELHDALVRLVPDNHPGFLMHDPGFSPLSVFP